MSLVWLFKEHRNLYEENHHLKNILHDTIAETDKKIADLEDQLKFMKRPALDAETIHKLAEELFQDQPYEGGKIPDDVWLTPGPPDRDTR
jgi:hypothetical protein